MIKVIKKTLRGSLFILTASFILYTVLLVNPTIMYSTCTQIDRVKIYHNIALENETEKVIKDALAIIETAEIFSDEIIIELCLNGDSSYPTLLGKIRGGTAYSFLNKAVINYCSPSFEENVAEFQWEINENEVRKMNLTWLLAHEFTHTLQWKSDPYFVLKNISKTTSWKLEGYAEYISRQFQNDNKLKDKIHLMLLEERQTHIGIPVFLVKDGTIQNLSYFKYALMNQYLIEEQNFNYHQICRDKRTYNEVYAEMINWSKDTKDE